MGWPICCVGCAIVVLGTPVKACGKAQGKRVHINACKPYVEMSVHKVAVWASEDGLLEQQAMLLGEAYPPLFENSNQGHTTPTT